MHHVPMFYNDEHAERLLKKGPRFFNIFVSNSTGTHAVGSAHERRSIAEASDTTRFYGKAAYRIVVRLKPNGIKTATTAKFNLHEDWRRK